VKNLQFHFINTGTAAYKEMIALRMQVLLGPIGIPRSYIDAQKEAQDLLIGGYADELLVGCCILTKVDKSVVQLRQMAVHTAHQQQGIGAALLSFAEVVASEKGYTTLIMHARDTVLSFYEKCGYTTCSDQFFEVGIPHHKMQKKLSSAKAV
jgi:predicted GNAT family N-acyltransferase